MEEAQGHEGTCSVSQGGSWLQPPSPLPKGTRSDGRHRPNGHLITLVMCYPHRTHRAQGKVLVFSVYVLSLQLELEARVC